MGDWSTIIALLRYSRPSRPSCAPGSFFAFQKYCMSAFPKISFTNDDLPDPETPDTHTNLPKGIFTSMFFRLCSVAPRITRSCAELRRTPASREPCAELRETFLRGSAYGSALFCAGRRIVRLPDRYSPVSVFDLSSP